MEGARSFKSTKKRSQLQQQQQSSNPFNTRTSAQIIAEARQSVRALPTGRPFTPADFDKQSRGRPPSVYSIGARHFSEEQTSRPTTSQKPPSRQGTSQKLPPIEKSLPPPSTTSSKHVKPTPPTPVQSTTNILEEEADMESRIPASVSSLATGSHATGESFKDPDRACVPPPQNTGKTSQSQAKKSMLSRKDEIDAYWEAEITPLLRDLDQTSVEVAQLCELCRTLWNQLEGKGLLGRSGGDAGTKRRAAVLRSLFRLLDHTDSHLLLRLARIILAMKVTGKNLLNTCKLLFNVSRTEANDVLFSEEQVLCPLVELLRETDPLVDMDAMVYGMGTLKMLSGNKGLCETLVRAGMNDLLASVLQRCTEPSLDDASKSNCANLLVQLTITLRNLSENPTSCLEIIKDKVVTMLCPVLGAYLQDKDIVFNIVRVLSKLTLHKEGEEAIQNCPAFLPLLLQALACHIDNPDTAVRICFVLGNLSADHDPTREHLFFTHRAMPLLNDLCTRYFGAEMAQLKKIANKHLGKEEDVLIKLVRVMANLTVHPKVGPSVANDSDTLRNLLAILGAVSPIAYEELVLNVLATLNNISFYAGPSSHLVDMQEDIASLLLQVVLQDSGDCLLECIRVYGNLSRYPNIRKLLRETKVDEIVITLLDSGRMELVYASCGILINMMVDAPWRATLARMGGVRKLIDVLRDLACEDWQLASLVCKTLWNFSENLTDISSCLNADEVDELIQLLRTYTENQPFCEDPNSPWQTEFIPVAQLLLHRIEHAQVSQ